MQARDVRAIENPLTAIFDLAEEVEAQTPKIQQLLRYTVWFVSMWLLLGFVLIVFISAMHALALLFTLLLFGLLILRGQVQSVTGEGLAFAAAIIVGVLVILTFGPGIVLGIVLVALLFLGMTILDLVEDARALFAYHALRYRVIRAVRDADPIVHVPQGATPVARLLASLRDRNPTIAEMLAHPQAARSPAILTGKSGVAYEFDAFVTWPAGMLAPFGIGPRGAAVYVKAFGHAPARADLEALRRAVEDVSLALRMPPTRVIALWKSDGTHDVPEEAYTFLTTEVVSAFVRGRKASCSMELVTEMPDGTYDFIPLIVEASPAAPAAAGTARPA